MAQEEVDISGFPEEELRELVASARAAAAQLKWVPQPGPQLAALQSHADVLLFGAFLAWAAYSPQSQIRARVWGWDESERIDARAFIERVRAAIARRADLASAGDALRLIHGEADALPGVVGAAYPTSNPRLAARPS